MPEPMSLSSRLHGSLVGGAIGDALGGQYENQNPVQDQDLVIWGDWEIPQSEWQLSDDTQLSIATCEAILDRKGVFPEHIAERFLHWHQCGKLSGLGSATLQAIRGLQAGGHWALVGKKGEQAAGNGAAMRIAPLAFIPEEVPRDLFRDICRITHHNEEAYAGALAIYWAIRFWRQGEKFSPQDWMKDIADLLPDSLVRDRMQDIIPLFPHTQIQQIAHTFGSSGYVVESVPLSIYAAAQSTELGFEAVMNLLIQVGGDTDTNASMFGHIFGAKYGLEGLPESWKHRLQSFEEYALIDAIVQRWRILYS